MPLGPEDIAHEQIDRMLIQSGSNGIKRIGSFLFLLYMEQEGMISRMNETALTALALLIAESAPSNKDLLIRLIINLLTAD